SGATDTRSSRSAGLRRSNVAPCDAGVGGSPIRFWTSNWAFNSSRSVGVRGRGLPAVPLREIGGLPEAFQYRCDAGLAASDVLASVATGHTDADRKSTRLNSS